MPTTHPEESIDVGLAASPVYASTTISVPLSFKRRSIPRATKPQLVMLFLSLVWRDIELNPGPAMADDTCACGYCQLRVSWRDLAMCCDDCGVWFHKVCQSIPSAEFSNIENVPWGCYRCHLINHNNNTFHSYELMSSLDEFVLRGTLSFSNISLGSLLLPPSTIMPSVFSSPVSGGPVPGGHTPSQSATSSHSSNHVSSVGSTRNDLAAKHRNMHTLIINANDIQGKSVTFANLIDYTKPDVVLMQETKLDSNLKSGEFMPPGYLSPVRLDRNKHGGGVFIAVRDCFSAVKVDQPDCSAEMFWAEVALRGKKKLYVGSFYRGNYDTETARGKPLDQCKNLTSLSITSNHLLKNQT